MNADQRDATQPHECFGFSESTTHCGQCGWPLKPGFTIRKATEKGMATEPLDRARLRANIQSWIASNRALMFNNPIGEAAPITPAVLADVSGRGDLCAKCGRDLRDDIHIRAMTPIGEAEPREGGTVASDDPLCAVCGQPAYHRLHVPGQGKNNDYERKPTPAPHALDVEGVMVMVREYGVACKSENSRAVIAARGRLLAAIESKLRAAFPQSSFDKTKPE